MWPPLCARTGQPCDKAVTQGALCPQIQYGIGAAADVILVAFLFLHVAERHFQLATSAVLAASALGVVGAAAISERSA
jgi:hypothetical protein